MSDNISFPFWGKYSNANKLSLLVILQELFWEIGI